jgi:two-component system sensor histidine kinase YesM
MIQKLWKRNNSLKNRLFQLIMLGTIVSILVSFILSRMTISSVEKEQIHSAMQFSLDQICSCFDQGYLNLVNIMQNLEAKGSCGEAVITYLEQPETYDKRVQKQHVEEQIANTLFTNLNVRRISYQDSESGEVLFSGGSVYGETTEQAKKLKQMGDNLFYGIENSSNAYHSKYLISMKKEKQYFENDLLDIYLALQIDNTDKADYKLLQLDGNMKIIYSECADFQEGETLDIARGDEKTEEGFQRNGYYLLLKKNQMGFYYALSLPLSVYNRETNIWQKRSIIVSLIILALFYSIVLAIYQMIGKPIRKLREEIKETGKGNFEAIKSDMGIEEFDQVLETISQMRRNIKQLQEQERTGYELRKKAELEKLMYQINPHFVLNTLYSVQWMAQKEGNLEIRGFVHDLMVILSYNLGKEKAVSTLRTEVEIARKYIEIQKQRYDFEIMLEVEEGEYLDEPTIRMLLQPLIENSLQHGLGESGRLEVWIFEDTSRNYAAIIVRDYGEGLNMEEYDRICRPLGVEPESPQKAGIGFRYVRYMLEAFYGEKAILNVNSAIGKGTKINILIPLRERAGGHRPGENIGEEKH